MGDIASFENYCMVCDRLIVAPREPDVTEKKVPKKKAQGAIRIKNPDGSTTIRTANGVKTTRPPMRRPSSAAQVEVVKTSEPLRRGSSDNGANVAAAPVEPPFVSSIYCSQKCADHDAGSSGPEAYENMARVFGLGLTTTSDSILVPGHIGSMIATPPSPLLGSDTDTSSSAVTTSSPASVPKMIGFFRPEDTLKEVARQRRSSLAHTSRFSITPFEPVIPSQQMSRQRSSMSSGRPRSTASATSSDSLSSLWLGEQDYGMSRMTSTANMTPNVMPVSRRASSECPPTVVRPILPRAAASHVSLGVGLSSPHVGTPTHEVGSAPGQAAVLMQSYASAFPARDGSPMIKPHSGLQTPDLRSSSVATAVTIRPRPRTGSAAAGSWDAFGKAEVEERHRRTTRLGSGSSALDTEDGPSRVPSTLDLDCWRQRAGSIGTDATPKQSLEDGCWQIRYTRSSSRGGSRSRSASREPRTACVPEDEDSHAISMARPIPMRPRKASATVLASSNSTARSRTPQTSRLSNSIVNSRRSGSTVPDLAAIAALRVGSPCAAIVSPENASPRDQARSVPRAGFDWNPNQHRTYELPPGVVVNPNKGLFYFKA